MCDVSTYLNRFVPREQHGAIYIVITSRSTATGGDLIPGATDPSKLHFDKIILPGDAHYHMRTLREKLFFNQASQFS